VNGGELVPRVRTVVGDPDQVAAALRRLDARGRLIAMTPAKPLPDGRVRVGIKLWEPAPAAVPVPAPAPERPARRVRVVVAAVVGGLAVLAGAGLAVALVARVVVEHLALVVGAVGLALLVWVGLGKVGVCCPGLHCAGCRHGS